MKQPQLERLVADATGEDLHEIRRRGFSLADPTEVNFDPEPNCLLPQTIDWDELDDQRYRRRMWRPHHEPAAT